MLIPHEFAHSWNGKFRRPYGQDVRSSIAPQSADLIWVYEGLTEYLGDVYMVRSGFRAAGGMAARPEKSERPPALRAGPRLAERRRRRAGRRPTPTFKARVRRCAA